MKQPISDSAQPVEPVASLTSNLDAIEPGKASAPLEFAECLEDCHPTMNARVKVATGSSSYWVLCLTNIRPRVGDRLLVAQVGSEGERLVVGVVDGLRERTPPHPAGVQTRRIRDDEAVIIESPGGEPLVEIRAEAGRTTLRIIAKKTRFEATGHLELAAESVAIVASKGPIKLTATEDVRVVGETIELN